MLRALVVIVALVVVGLAALLLNSKPVGASGGVGTGGSAGGTTVSGGYYSYNGWGWAQYSLAGKGPTDYTAGTATWDSIKSACSDANSVITFVALNPQKKARVYADTGWEGRSFGESWSSYPGPLLDHQESGSTSDGGAFMASSSAEWAFSQLGNYGVDTSGYTFGKNVAWFCWDFKPVTPPAHYYLTPSVSSVDPSSAAEPSTSITVKPNVNNSGTKNSDAAPWQVSRFYLASGKTAPVGSSDSDKAPAEYYGNGLISLGGDGGGIFAPGDTNPGTQTDTIGDQAVGTQVCYAVSVQKYTDDPSTSHWRHSAPTCIKIGKRPKVQVWGGDLMSSGAVNTSTASKIIGGSSRTFGSWIEYGIFAINTITGTASGSAYAGAGLVSANNCNSGTLSFANSTPSGTCLSSTVIGKYTNSLAIPNVGASFPTAGAPTIGSNDLSSSSSSGIYTASGSVTLKGGTINQGRWVVINAPTADITINGNINYTNGTLHSMADIPQVVIIANNINITSNVTQVDAWLIAKGNLNTCSDVAGNLSSNLCSNPLTVNGPVAANKLYLRRTAGSGTGADHSGDPAEVFNLRPDAFMWASLRATGAGNRIQTVYTTELPPRL